MNRIIDITNCPDEAKLLAFFEKRLAYFGRRGIRGHLASCSDCCDSLAFLVKNFDGSAGEDAARAFELESGALRAQTASVIALIERTDRMEASARSRPRTAPRTASIALARFGVILSYRALVAAAVVVMAVGVSVYMVLLRSSASDEAMKYVAAGVISERRIGPQMPGIPYSRFAGDQRGGDETTVETPFERALLKVSPNGLIPSGVSGRMAMVTAYLEWNRPGDAARALAIIEETMNRGAITGELLLARGVALYQVSLEPRDDSLERCELAIRFFTSALERSPKLHIAYFDRALAEEKLKRFADAKSDMQLYVSYETNSEWINEARDHIVQIDQAANERR